MLTNSANSDGFHVFRLLRGDETLNFAKWFKGYGQTVLKSINLRNNLMMTPKNGNKACKATLYFVDGRTYTLFGYN